MKRKENMPSWVYWGLLSINSRKIAMGYFIGTLLLSFVLVPLGFQTDKFTYVFFVLVPIWYWVSIKWADNHNAWDDETQP